MRIRIRGRNPAEFRKSILTITEYGKLVRVDQYVQKIDARSLENDNAWLDGQKFLRTADGKPCNKLDDGTFQVVGTNQILRPIDE